MPITLIIFIFLSACNSSAGANTNNKDQIIINVKNNTNFEIYALELSWYQNGNLKGTQGTMNADGSKIGKGENFVFELIESDLNINEKTLFEVAVLDDQDSMNKITINNKVPLQLAKNTEYNLELKGDKQDNLTVNIMNQIN